MLCTSWEPGLGFGAVEMMDDRGTLSVLPFSQRLTANSLVDLGKPWSVSRDIWNACLLSLFLLLGSSPELRAYLLFHLLGKPSGL